MLRSAQTSAVLHLAHLSNKPRILVLFGSCRERSRSRMLANEAREVLMALGAEVEVLDPKGLPLEGNDRKDEPRIAELHRLVTWSDGQVWCSPEHHGSMSGVMKLVLDCFPCDRRGRVEAGGKALALMQVAGGTISCNALQDMQRAGRSMGMYIASRQFSLGEADRQFDAEGKLVRSELKTRLEDVMSEVIKLSVMLRESTLWLGASTDLLRNDDVPDLERPEASARQ